jgi:hypothetical protein
MSRCFYSMPCEPLHDSDSHVAAQTGLGAVETYGGPVDLVNRLNEQWVVAVRRMSPRLLRELPALTGPRVEAYFSSLTSK